MPVLQQRPPIHSDRRPPAPRRRLARRLGGVEGNERLTAVVGVVLIVMLLGEGATLLGIVQHLSWHIFLGLALIPPIGLKLAGVGWRFARYYLGHRPYVERGPPHPWLRLMAPAYVATTVALFATGVGLMLVGPAGGVMLGLHKASFALWLPLNGVHVLAHLQGALRGAGNELRRGTRALAGSSLRRYALVAALVAGLVVGLATLPTQGPWLSWAKTHQFQDGGDR